MIEKMITKHLTLYVTLQSTVHAQNLPTYMNVIRGSHQTPYIIAVDACLGGSSSIGDIIIGSGPLFPGQALNKHLPPIGDGYIKGIVNQGGFRENEVLQNTRLSLVFDLAKSITSLLDQLDNHLIHSVSTPARLAKQPRHIDTLTYL